MAGQDLIKSTNGEHANLPVRRQDEVSFPYFANEVTEWMNRWDKWFDNLLSRSFGVTPGTSLAPNWGTNWSGWSGFTPALNISETPGEFQVTVELPGMDEKDIDISLHDDSLTIKGEKKHETTEKGENYYRVERSFGAFQRTIPLSAEIDQDKAGATFNKGVLTITLPKLPESQTGAKKIQIKTEEK